MFLSAQKVWGQTELEGSMGPLWSFLAWLQPLRNLGLERPWGQRLGGSGGSLSVETKSGSGATKDGGDAWFLLGPWSSRKVPRKCCLLQVERRLSAASGPGFPLGTVREHPPAPGDANLAPGRVHVALGSLFLFFHVMGSHQ